MNGLIAEENQGVASRRRGEWNRRLPVALLVASFTLEAVALILKATHPRATYDFIWEGSVATPVFAILGYLLATHRPENRISWFFAIGGIGGSLQLLLGQYALTGARYGGWPGFEVAGWLSQQVQLTIVMLIILLLFLFPTGRLLSPLWRIPLSLTVGGFLLGALSFMFVSGPLENLPAINNPFGLVDTVPGFLSTAGAVLILGGVLSALVSQVLRFRRASGEERHQIKWFVYAAVIGAVILFSSGSSEAWGSFLWTVVPLSLPISIGIAILKYRLYDIDVVINKTLVYGALASFITAVYVAIVVGVGTALGSSDSPNLALSIAATAIVAIAFQPVKNRVERVANRLVYGHRQTPYEVMAGLSRAVSGVLLPNEILPAIAEVTAHGIGADVCRITLVLHSGGSVTEAYPRQVTESVDYDATVSLMHRGVGIGELSVSKPKGDALTEADRVLLDDLSAQMGLGLHNARLAIELQERLDQISAQATDLDYSRRRIISAQDDSRARLEQEISSGPRSDLHGMREQLEKVQGAMKDNPTRASELLETLGDQTQVTLDALRDLARGLFPPLLADKGVVAALEAHVRKQDLDARIDARDDVSKSRFDEQIEIAAFFCCVEVLRDHIGPVSIILGVEPNALDLSIEGAEVNDETLQAISDRTEAVGGTIRTSERSVQLRLPAQVLALES